MFPPGFMPDDDPELRRMAAVQNMGGAMAADPAITGSPANDHVFTYHHEDGRLLAFAREGSTVTPYEPTGCSARVVQELVELRATEKHPWTAAIVRLDKSASQLGFDFLRDDAALVDPRSRSLIEIATEACTPRR